MGDKSITRGERAALSQCHGCDSRVDRVAVTVPDRRGVRSAQPAAASSRPPARGAAHPNGRGGQRDLADRRPALSQSGSRSGDAAAVAGGDTLPVDFRDTPCRRAGRTTSRSAPAGARRDASCGRLSGPGRTAAGVAQRFPRSRRPPCRCCSNPAGEGPARTGFFSGLERPSGTSDSIRGRGDDEDRFRGWPASRAARTHVLASNRPAPLGRSEPSILTPSFPLHRCA